jgi:hypothetical protein
MKTLLIFALALFGLATVNAQSASTPEQLQKISHTPAEVKEALWFVNLIKAHANKDFFPPPTATVNDLAQVVQSYGLAHPKLNGQVTEMDALQALAEKYPPPPGYISRLATTEDLVGLWKVVPLDHADEIDKVNPWPLSYQWFRFSKDGTVRSMMKSKDADYSTDELNKALDVFASVASPRYSWEQGYLVIRYPNMEAIDVWKVYIYMRNVINNKVGVILKGDVMMEMVGEKEHAYVYFRRMRKLANQ